MKSPIGKALCVISLIEWVSPCYNPVANCVTTSTLNLDKYSEITIVLESVLVLIAFGLAVEVQQFMPKFFIIRLM